jgi:hypothetical protein
MVVCVIACMGGIVAFCVEDWFALTILSIIAVVSGFHNMLASVVSRLATRLSDVHM